jgi:hypothetical protein
VDDHDLFLFDLQGFITVPNALNTAQLAELNAILDVHIAQDLAPDAASRRTSKPSSTASSGLITSMPTSSAAAGGRLARACMAARRRSMRRSITIITMGASTTG